MKKRISIAAIAALVLAAFGACQYEDDNLIYTPGTPEIECDFDQDGDTDCTGAEVCVSGPGSTTPCPCEPGGMVGNTCSDYVVGCVCEVPAAVCGNGVLEGTEVCDDGNTVDCDGCRGDCSAVETGCGDGFLCGTEVCDDGNTVDCDSCRGDCSAVETGCGDGFVCGTEACDDGGESATCNADCTVAACGDNVVNATAGEACDDGNTADCDGCHGDCSAVETGCGDGFLCGNEECDDGNLVNGDGCSDMCLMETVDCTISANCALADCKEDPACVCTTVDMVLLGGGNFHARTGQGDLITDDYGSNPASPNLEMTQYDNGLTLYVEAPQISLEHDGTLCAYLQGQPFEITPTGTCSTVDPLPNGSFNRNTAPATTYYTFQVAPCTVP